MSHRTFTAEELADYLHVSASDLERLLHESDIPKKNAAGA